jgi:hypothetical protein
MQQISDHYAADLSIADLRWNEHETATSHGRRIGMIIVLCAALGTVGTVALALF